MAAILTKNQDLITVITKNHLTVKIAELIFKIEANTKPAIVSNQFKIKTMTYKKVFIH